MNEIPPDTTAPWGIISVKGQLCDFELVDFVLLCSLLTLIPLLANAANNYDAKCLG